MGKCNLFLNNFFAGAKILCICAGDNFIFWDLEFIFEGG